MRRKRVLVIAAVLVVSAGLTIFFVAKRGSESGNDVKSATSSETISSESIGMIVQKDTSLVQQPVKQSSEDKGQLWAFGPPAGSGQQFLIDANYEKGESLKKLAGYTNQPLRDSVVKNVNFQLPIQYPEYKEITQRNLTINGIEANETIFEYDSQGTKVRQRFMLYFKNSDTAVYVRAQAKADEFDNLNSKYFEPLLMSVKFH